MSFALPPPPPLPSQASAHRLPFSVALAGLKLWLEAVMMPPICTPLAARGAKACQPWLAMPETVLPLKLVAQL